MISVTNVVVQDRLRIGAGADENGGYDGSVGVIQRGVSCF